MFQSDSHLQEMETWLTLADMSRGCGVRAEKLLLLVEEGVLEPCGCSPSEWRFQPADLSRALCALRLERDLGINPPGAALAVELLDELQQLRRHIELLEALIFRD